MKTAALALLLWSSARMCVASQAAGQAELGVFEAHADVGDTPKAGSVEFNAAAGEYRVTGGGSNIWSTVDAFQYLWKKLSGDVTVTADVRFIGDGAVGHRKAVLMIRQSLDAGAAYADLALHGDGLTSLQFRPAGGAATEEVKAAVSAPRRIRIERRGNQFTMYLANAGEELKPAGTAAVPLQDPVYVGIGICSHDANVLETAVFSNVQVESASARPAASARKGSKISIFDLSDQSIRVLYASDQWFEAPNWYPDEKYLLVNSRGNLFRLAVDEPASEPRKLDIGSISHANNDHGITRDGQWVALSAQSGSPESRVFLAPVDALSSGGGSNPKLITPQGPSYFHGWSPDGRWLAFVGKRNGNFDIFRIAAAGGEEQRLTSHAGYDDGPDYSPDGKWIYFNSDRSGSWDIWRMPPEGSGAGDRQAQQVTRDELEDWFPHPSPDGKWLVFLSFPKGTQGHDAEMEVSLRMMPLPGRKPGNASIQVLGKVFGGQGTINVNSWSPDSKKFAFVTYEVDPR